MSRRISDALRPCYGKTGIPFKVSAAWTKDLSSSTSIHNRRLVSQLDAKREPPGSVNKRALGIGLLRLYEGICTVPSSTKDLHKVEQGEFV